MKINQLLLIAALIVVASMVTVGVVIARGQAAPVGVPAADTPLGMAFTYQGQLRQRGSPANGVFDFEVKLFDAQTAGGQVGGAVTKGDVPVVDGLFTMQLDFGSNAFTGDARWLEVGVRGGNATGNYTLLTPRQRLTPTPYAIFATNAWSITGNSGATAGTNYLGTRDNQPLVIKTNNTEAARIAADGKVGIGTASPGSPLEVSGAAEVTNLLDNDASNFFDGGCADNQHVTGIGADGALSCDADSGDISAVAAGAGLSGGGTGGAVTLNANTAVLQQRVAGVCAAGSSIRLINQDGTVTCAANAGSMGGAGTANRIGKFTAATTLGNSGIVEVASGNVGIGTETPEAKLHVAGEIKAPFFRAGQGYRAEVEGGRWYRIAQVRTPREAANAEFTVRDYTGISPGFSSVTFRFGAGRRDANGMSFTLLSHSWWTQSIFKKARVVYRPPAPIQHSILYLEVYVSKNIPVTVDFSIHDNLQVSGWEPINWLQVAAEIPVVADPPYASHEFDLDRLFGVGDSEDRFTVARGGNVGIGTTTPQAKLEVSGGDIRVTGGNFIDDGTTLTVPDQVLEENYPLLSLEELREYIDREGHLPDVPSEADIKAEGLNLSEFQMTLLKKIEELTLYTLEQQEDLEAQQQQIAELQAQVDLLK